jgi:hypothetical protein
VRFNLNGTRSSLTIMCSLPTAKIANPDISRIIESEEIQAVIRPEREMPRSAPRRRNPLKNKLAMARLNPYAEELRAYLLHPIFATFSENQTNSS